jgi:hypothetical protein
LALLIVSARPRSLQLADDERLVQLERDLLGQAALVQLQLGPTTITERAE